MEKSRELDTIRDSLTKSEERAKTDTLTGLPNRRALEEFFRKAQLAAMEQDDPLSVLLIDIDHFKRFNDEFGHGVGDQVLRLMAKVLREGVREIDLPARYGGEELIVVLPSAGLATCAADCGTDPAFGCGMPASPAVRPAKPCPASRSRSGWRSSRAANPWPI